LKRKEEKGERKERERCAVSHFHLSTCTSIYIVPVPSIGKEGRGRRRKSGGGKKEGGEKTGSRITFHLHPIGVGKGKKGRRKSGKEEKEGKRKEGIRPAVTAYHFFNRSHLSSDPPRHRRQRGKGKEKGAFRKRGKGDSHLQSTLTFHFFSRPASACAVDGREKRAKGREALTKKRKEREKGGERG